MSAKDIPIKADKMFLNYLYRVKLLGKIRKDSVQYKELERAFYGALGNMVLILGHPLFEHNLTDIISELQDDVKEYWKVQKKEKV